VLALLFTGVLVTKIHLGGLLVLTVTFALAVSNWFWMVRYSKNSAA